MKDNVSFQEQTKNQLIEVKCVFSFILVQQTNFKIYLYIANDFAH